MPTYEYECDDCGHRFEQLQKITADPLTDCPECSGGLRRLIGAGAGLIFKGSGFYITDYRSEDGRPEESSETEGSNAADGSEDTSGDASSSEGTDGSG